MKAKIYKILGITLAALALFVAAFMYSNKVAPISWGFYGDTYTEKGIALNGADVVAYFTEGKYVQGNPEYSAKINDATWHFSSEVNRQLFKKMPENYLPQYGGYCAFAVSQGVTASIVPDAWTIQKGKLYLFNGPEPRDDWMKDLSNGVIATSDKSWASR